MTRRRLVAALAAACALLGPADAQPSSTKHTDKDNAYLFAYFKEPGSQGLYLALSHDGYKFQPLNAGEPWVKPDRPGEIMRDVFITRNPDKSGFKMVWTWGWKGNSLGYAESADLLHWSPQREIKVMQNFPNVRNVWAPEIYWDDARHGWLVIWSSAFDDRPAGNRIWASYTKDFVTFSEPKLFFDPGYVVIDATLFHGWVAGRQQWALVFKDQTVDPLRYQVRWASGPSPHGPWGNIEAPVTRSWSEGPSVVQIGKSWVIYYDHYRGPRARYEGVQTEDWVHWTSVNDRMEFPAACKHGSFLRLTDSEARALLSRHE